MTGKDQPLVSPWSPLNVTNLVSWGPEMTQGYIEYALHGEDRPRLLSIYNATDILVEKWMLDCGDEGDRG